MWMQIRISRNTACLTDSNKQENDPRACILPTAGFQKPIHEATRLLIGCSVAKTRYDTWFVSVFHYESCRLKIPINALLHSSVFWIVGYNFFCGCFAVLRRSCWFRKYVFLCTACGGLAVLLGALFLTVYFMLRSYTSSLNYFETVPTYVPAAMVSSSPRAPH